MRPVGHCVAFLAIRYLGIVLIASFIPVFLEVRREVVNMLRR
jgi:hypothetical protein